MRHMSHDQASHASHDTRAACRTRHTSHDYRNTCTIRNETGHDTQHAPHEQCITRPTRHMNSLHLQHTSQIQVNHTRQMSSFSFSSLGNIYGFVCNPASGKFDFPFTECTNLREAWSMLYTIGGVWFSVSFQWVVLIKRNISIHFPFVCVNETSLVCVRF